MTIAKKLTSALLTFGVGSGVAQAEYALNLREGVTKISHDVYDLHMLILWICVAIGVVVFGVMFWSIFHHRKSRGAVAATFHESTKVEIIWTIIPFAILISMAIPATKTLVEMHDAKDTEMTIKVTGYQWKWRYQYLDDEIDFFSNLDAESNKARQLGSAMDPSSVENYLLNVDNVVVIPTNTRIRFLFTGADVLHSWWVPDLGWKKDTIPGYVNESWTEVLEPGIYRGQCAELCGRDHGFMPIVVKAVSKEDYQAWVAEWKEGNNSAAAEEVELTEDGLMAKGEEVYNANCAACHMANGEGLPPTFPAIAGGAIATGDIAEHVELVLNGKGAMPAFGKGMLNDTEIAAVITYQRNAFGNETGDILMPSELDDYR